MNVLPFIGRGLGRRPHDHGRRSDVLAASGEDRCLPLALLDLIIHMACPHMCALVVEVLWTRAFAIVTFVGPFSLKSFSSFQALLLILCSLLGHE